MSTVRSGLLGPPARPEDPIRIGFQVWNMGIAWTDLMAIGERIEAMGFASPFANDHMMPVLGVCRAAVFELVLHPHATDTGASVVAGQRANREYLRRLGL